MDKLERIKELVSTLTEASISYYGKDNPIMSDKQYDDLYDELAKLEAETGLIMASSPTQKVQGFILDGLNKVEHSKPMLSAAKTKEPEEIKRFVGNNKFYCSWKLDGLTLVVRYENGKFVKGITRGNGIVGEDVTEACRFIPNLPMTIPNKHTLELRGECVISYKEFERVNSKLDEPYSHPRNLAAGSIRNLNLNVIKERNLSFVVFELVTPTFTWKSEGLDALEKLGFEVVERCTCLGDVDNCINMMKPEKSIYPVDGLIFELDNTEYSKSLGATAHHENARMALKWSDQLYETELLDVEWSTSKTGLINPVAVFKPVDLDGAVTTRATLHNLSYIEDLQLGIGDVIQVYRANMVIPKVHDNLTKSNNIVYPSTCPCCGGNTEIHNENGSKTLHCTNLDCQAKLNAKLVHACSKNALNIDGMSEATIDFLVNKGWVSCICDLFNLKKYEKEWSKCEGFGKKSVEKLLAAIEDSRKVSLQRFLYAQSIPLVGKSASKDLSKYCDDNIEQFVECVSGGEDFTIIGGFGNEMQKSLINWWVSNAEAFVELSKEFTFENNNNSSEVTNQMLLNKIFVITGSLNHFKNRDELVSKIEEMGGKVSGSVSAKTSYLINNDTTSNSSKNKKAKDLNIPIISEQEFVDMIQG